MIATSNDPDSPSDVNPKLVPRSRKIPRPDQLCQTRHPGALSSCTAHRPCPIWLLFICVHLGTVLLIETIPNIYLAPPSILSPSLPSTPARR